MCEQLKETTSFVSRMLDIDNASFNSDKNRTSNDHEQQKLCCTENTDVNIYENKAGDSNVARGSFPHNIHDGYDNIKDNEINNGNDDRDKN